MNSSTSLTPKLARDMVDQAVESGRRPLLALGPDAVHPEGLANLPTLVALREQAQPPLALYWVVGEADLWYLAGLAWHPRPPVGPVLYAGNDRATFVAAADIATAEPNPANWPPGLAWSVASQALPGARTEPEQIPMRLAAWEAPSEAERWSRIQAWLALVAALAMALAAWLL